MKLKQLIFYCLCLLVFACGKRKYPTEQVNIETQDIFCDAFIDGEPFSLAAGADGYYCYSSYTQRPDSIYVFEGELRKYECNLCDQVLRIELADYRPRFPGSAIPTDSVFVTGMRKFSPGASKPVTLKFNAHSNKQIAVTSWKLSNGTTSDASILETEFAQPGVQTVSLTLRTQGNCASTVINKIFVGGNGGLFACDISAALVQQNETEFNARCIGGKPPYTYTWYFGDGISTTGIVARHAYTYSGSYPVKLIVEDSDHHSSESNYIHVAGNDYSSCSAHMTLLKTGERNAFLNGAKIQWTDASNKIFRSDSIVQPADSYFEITGSQPYEPNEKGEPGRLLTLRYNVVLASGSKRIQFKSDKTSIAVTYK